MHRMPKRPEPKTFQVLAARLLTPNMRRVTIGGDALASFPAGQAGGYVKLMLPAGGRAAVRTYTISAQRDDGLDIDFALHGAGGEGGPAVAWSRTARPGDTVTVGGPGPAKPLPPGADHYLVFGDMTALPAIAVNLAALPADARGHALIEIQSEADRQDIDHPDGLELHWLVNPQPGHDPHLFEGVARSLGWPEGRVYAWSASEFETMRRMRRYLREERGLGPSDLYISSYWKHGLVEDEHRTVKRADAEASV